jgi:hypothetical protein
LKSYDIIGDVHGYATTLEKLLERLGYSKKGGTYSHPTRQAIFVGDIIDRGPKIREALHLVRRMVLEGAALMVLGNHEFNAIGWHTKWYDGSHLRVHSTPNRRQHAATLKAFCRYKSEWQEFFEWFHTLPLSLELDGIRVVHAAWDDFAHGFAGPLPLQKHKVPAGLIRTSKSDNPSFNTNRNYELLCKGYETKLPEGHYFLDHEGNVRTELRTRWWLGAKGRTYPDLSFDRSLELPDILIKDPDLPQADYQSDVPVFFGHYAADPSELILTPRIACLDYGIYKGHPLHAYRWDGERTLSPEKIVKMPNMEPAKPSTRSSF